MMNQALQENIMEWRNLLRLIRSDLPWQVESWFSPHPNLLPSREKVQKIKVRKNAMVVTFIFKNYFAVYPPSTGSTAPVINEASSDAKKRIAWAISSG